MNESDNKIPQKAVELLENIDDVESDLKSYYLTHQVPTTKKIAKSFAIRYLQANYNFYGYLIHEYMNGNNFLGYSRDVMQTQSLTFDIINLALRQVKHEHKWSVTKEYFENEGQSLIEKASRLTEIDIGIDQEMKLLGQALYDIAYVL